MHLFLQFFIILITCITGHKGISSTNKIIESNLAIELYLDGNYVEAISEWQTLAKNAINILAISTSEIKISVLIDEEHTNIAVKSLHEVYNL